MSKNQIKQRLNSYRQVQLERRQILDRIMRLESRLTAPGGQNLDGMPHGAGNGDALTQGVVRLAELRDLYKAREADLAQAQMDIEHLIDNLDPIERVIARYRYIDGLHWEQICVKINYSWRQTHRIHSDMIDKLAKEEQA
jgi:DNA-directed RNA polymerase specialized sigma24 family protein